MATKFPHTIVQCLTAIAQHHGLQINPERLIHEYALNDEEPRLSLVIRMATEMGLKARGERFSWKGFFDQEGVFPILARRTDGSGVIVAGIRGGQGEGENCIAILDPMADMNSIIWVNSETFCQHWDGDVVFLKRTHSITDPNQPFGLRWFIPEILKQKAAFRDIIIAAIAMNLLSLASPMFFQIVIDKVLAHQSESTLWVLTIGVLIALVFDSVFGYLRQLLLVVATNKIDMHLTRRVFGHLLTLSIDYFESTSAGVITRHMQQLESIRNFLTGRVFFTGLDTLGLLVSFPILFSYSFKLTLIVVVFTLILGGIIASVLPAYTRRLDALNAAEGKRQSLMVETIHGMRTVKALAIEPAQRRSWDQFSAESIGAHYRVSQLALNSNFITELLGKVLPVLIIVMGCQDVFDHTMSMGALIAFQMLSGRVTGPLLALVGLINEYQQTALSVRMLGSVINRPSEGRGAGGLRPQLQGTITFDNVTFRYPGASATALNRASFTIPAGAVVGIVGRSGSGKTTLTKLIQGLYPVQEGIVRFDGIDAREIDLSHLRKHIGVVLQENFLFRGTVRQNITVTRPDATFEEIVAAAQAAGADEFIERLEQGYDTFLEENASNLSGGQKQRLSIARSLLARPRILVLDEAASALDPESEAIFIRNLSQIAIGRTVVMISHRLSTLVNADIILVMQHGRLADAGRHEELLTRCETYQQLWYQQTSHL